MKLKIFLSTLAIMMMGTVSLFAQGALPCGDADPDAVCPLDTWVVGFAVIAALVTAIGLYRKQKSPLNSF